VSGWGGEIPSIGEIVANLEADIKAGGYGDDNYYGRLTVGNLRLLIADWRKMGGQLEAVLAELQDIRDDHTPPAR
jgi:hypothetical protein